MGYCHVLQTEMRSLQQKSEISLFFGTHIKAHLRFVLQVNAEYIIADVQIRLT